MKTLAKINPRLIYASFSAFGQNGPRGRQTAYDHVIQATSGIMAMTGTKEVSPIKFGSPAVDYATGMTGAFALSAALFQRERTGRGQRIDMAMLDVAMILMASHVTGYLRNGVHPKPHGNRHPHATNGAFTAKDGRLVMLGASNIRQQKRLWKLLGRPEMAKNTNDERDADHEYEVSVLENVMMTRTAAEWEEYLQANHVPAAQVRTMGEAIADPQMAARGVIHRHMQRLRHGRPVQRAARGVHLRARRPAHRCAAADARPAQRRDHRGACPSAEPAETRAGVGSLWNANVTRDRIPHARNHSRLSGLLAGHAPWVPIPQKWIGHPGVPIVWSRSSRAIEFRSDDLLHERLFFRPACRRIFRLSRRRGRAAS